MDKLPKDFTSTKDTYYAALNNIDHIRISSNGPSSMILSQIKYTGKKLKCDGQIMLQQVEAKRNNVINPHSTAPLSSFFFKNMVVD